MISFIVIGKNEGWRLKKCLDSVYFVIDEDNIKDYEVIYVDSKSIDDSINIAKSYIGINVYSITGECNAAIARNIGAKEAKGDILFFIDGDMEIQSGFIHRVIDRISGKLNYPFVSGVWNDLVYSTSWDYRYNINRDDNAKDTVEVTTGGLFIIEADLWKRVGGMDNRLKRHQDLDLGFRLNQLGYPLHRKKELLALHHTIKYSDREAATNYYKYTGLLLRKHFFSKMALRILVHNQYTSVILVLSILASVIFEWYCIFLYLLIAMYRTIKWYRSQKGGGIIKLFVIMKFVVARDLTFLFSFISYYPSIPSFSYKQYR